MVDQASKHHPELFKLAMVLALGQNCCECVNKSNHPGLDLVQELDLFQ